MNNKGGVNRFSKNLILGTSGATRGAYYNNMNLQKSSDPNAARTNLVLALKRTSWFERLWYPIFFLLGIACLIFIRPFTFELCFAVLSLWLYMFANNLLARGKLLGIILSIISSALYVVVSFFAKVYGEVIINILLYIPLDVIAVITFKKNTSSDSNELNIRKTNLKSATLIGLATVALSGIIFVVLYFIPGQVYPLLNTLSIALFLMALFVRNFRYKEFWWFNLLGNILSIVMWALVSTSSAEMLYSLPVALSSLAALLNNIYGIVLWHKMYRAEVTNGGIYLKKKVKINHVITIRRKYNEYLKWNASIEEKRKNKQMKINNGDGNGKQKS